jgi:hypothetical protein
MFWNGFKKPPLRGSLCTHRAKPIWNQKPNGKPWLPWIGSEIGTDPHKPQIDATTLRVNRKAKRNQALQSPAFKPVWTEKKRRILKQNGGTKT